MTMKPDFGGITRPHGSRSIKNQIRALCAAEQTRVQNVDQTGKLGDIIAESRAQPIGDPAQE